MTDDLPSMLLPLIADEMRGFVHFGSGVPATPQLITAATVSPARVGHTVPGADGLLKTP